MRQQPILLSNEEVSLLTPEERGRYEKALKIETALMSPIDYMTAVNPEAKDYAHIRYLSDVLVALVEHRLYAGGPGPPSIKNEKGQYAHPVTGERAIAQLQIDEPPGHGKSFMVSHHVPAWYLTNFPDRRVGLASYEADFAREWGGKAQQTIDEHPEFGISIDKKKMAQDNWGIAGHRGGMFTAGVGGPITGKRFHLGIVDDPIKNQDEALSETIRTRHRNWWATSFRTRAHPDGETVFILMATRWHEDDLTGQLIESEPEKWFRVSLPAIAFDTVDDEGYSIDEETGKRDPLNRRPGEALCPEMWSIDDLLDFKSAQGDLWFQAMYQGKPSISAGNKFSNFPRYRLQIDPIRGEVYTVLHPDGAVEQFLASKCFRFATIDLAMTKKTSSDWCVFAVWDVTHNHKLLLRNIDRQRVDSGGHVEWFEKNYVKWWPQYAGVEKEIRGTMLMQNIARLGKYATVPLDPDGDKEARAMPATTVWRDGLAFIPEEAEWVETWIKEHKGFPNAKYDDQVDTTSYAADIFYKMAPWQIARPIIDDSVEARMERYVDQMDVDRYEHPEIGYWQ